VINPDDTTLEGQQHFMNLFQSELSRQQAKNSETK
jgi:hypothetical protein